MHQTLPNPSQHWPEDSSPICPECTPRRMNQDEKVVEWIDANNTLLYFLIPIPSILV